MTRFTYALRHGLASILLVVNVVFWLTRMFDLRVAHWWAVVGYAIGVLLINYAHYWLFHRPQKEPAIQAWKYVVKDSTWNLATTEGNTERHESATATNAADRSTD